MANYLTSRKRPWCMLVSDNHLRHNKQLRKKATTTPWKDFWEFDCVGNGLLRALELKSDNLSSSDLQDIQNCISEALGRCDVWRLRDPHLPHAVESTASLASVISQDRIQSTGKVSSTVLRLSYASAVLRTVNGLADVLQQQRAVAMSVAALCVQLGIPAWLVDVRHEATHQILPTISVLRRAAYSLLVYLRSVFWDPLNHGVYGQINHSIDLLKEYSDRCPEPPTPGTGPDETVGESYDNQSFDSPSESDDDMDSKDNLIDTKLGTGINRFAVLLSKPAKQEEIQSEMKQPVKKSVQRKHRKTSTERRGQISIVREFSKSHISHEIARYSIVSFLIWAGIDGTGGVLIAGNQHFVQLRDLYCPLIRNVCHIWPGFYNTFLVHLVDAVLAVEDSLETMDVALQHKLSTLFSWVQFMFSRGFLKGAFPNLPLDMSKFFEQLCVPLNSLCDRCEDRPYPTSQALVDLLQKILGPSRIKDHGIDFSWPSSNDESNKGTSDANGCAEGYHMSLDEIEKLLESPNAVMVASSVANSIEQPPSHVTTSAPTNTQTFPATRPSWVRCQAWDPCSIGSLPGYPV